MGARRVPGPCPHFHTCGRGCGLGSRDIRQLWGRPCLWDLWCRVCEGRAQALQGSCTWAQPGHTRLQHELSFTTAQCALRSAQAQCTPALSTGLGAHQLLARSPVHSAPSMGWWLTCKTAGILAGKHPFYL